MTGFVFVILGLGGVLKSVNFWGGLRVLAGRTLFGGELSMPPGGPRFLETVKGGEAGTEDSGDESMFADVGDCCRDRDGD